MQLFVYFYPMKKYSLFIFALIFSLSACNSIEKNTFELNGTTNFPMENEFLGFKANANGQPSTIDTAVVSNGQFHFSGEVAQIDVNFLFIEGEQFNSAFIVEEGKIEVKLVQENLSSMELAGTPSNDDLHVYRKETQVIANDMNAIVAEIQQAIH